METSHKEDKHTSRFFFFYKMTQFNKLKEAHAVEVIEGKASELWNNEQTTLTGKNNGEVCMWCVRV